MKTIFHSFLYCCLLATVAHCVELEVNPELKKRLSIWLGSRLRRDLDSVTLEKTAESEHFVRPEDIRDTLLPHSSTDINVRTKRSNSANQSRKQDCSLGTCTLHDLALRLHQLNNKLKIGSAPVDKISRSQQKTEESEHFVRPEDIRDTLLPHSSTDINVRTKRSNSANQSRRQGCSLGTCTLHDLAHRLHQLNNKLKIGSAPVDKISPQGYGRRRRSLPVRRVTLRLEQGRLRPVWSTNESQVHKLEALLRRT